MTSRSMFLALALVTLALPVLAQPYGAWLIIPTRTPTSYITVPHDPAFNFTTTATFEAWVAISDPGACSSILGKTWTANYWVGICGTTLRSYVNGIPSLYDSGVVPANNWTHIAVVFDNGKRYHYVDGELAGTRDDSATFTTMGTSTSDFRIGSDVAYSFSPAGAIDEVRIWNVARTQAQIRASINTAINAPQAGLVAVYHLDGSGADAVAGHNGTTVNATFLTTPVALSCGVTTADALCIESSRYSVSVEWMTPDGVRGTGHVVPGSSAGSGNFWFFAPDNWELLVKVLNGCPVNNRKWAFSAATTNVHYELAVTDVRAAQVKRYFNYQGVNAPAVNDVGAFATCP